jgi:hypothetical protein
MPHWQNMISWLQNPRAHDHRHLPPGFSPAVDPRFIEVRDVVQTLERVCRIVGYPKAIRVDQGSEFISRDLDLWAYRRYVFLPFVYDESGRAIRDPNLGHVRLPSLEI